MSERDGNPEIYVMNSDSTNQTRITDSPATDEHPTWSPDGSRIAFVSERDGNAEVYVMNADGADPKNLSNNPEQDRWPTWSPDGSKVAFHSTRNYSTDIYVMDADGANQTQLTDVRWWSAHTALAPRVITWSASCPDWSPDGSKIAFVASDGFFAEVHIMAATGGPHAGISVVGDVELDPTWAPDGNRIAFASNRDGNPEIYLMNVDGTHQVRLTNSPGTDEAPDWDPSR